MGNKPSATDFTSGEFYDGDTSPQMRPRLSKNKSLSALTSLAKMRLGVSKNASSSPSVAGLRRRGVTSSAKLERTSRFSRSVTSGAINGHLLLTAKSHPASAISSTSDFHPQQKPETPATVITTSSQNTIVQSNNQSNDLSLSSSSSLSSSDAYAGLSSALLDSDYFVAPSSRSTVKRLAERRGPAMGTHAKPQSNSAKSSAALIPCTPVVVPSFNEQQPAVEEDALAPLANALEATLTSCSSDDASFLTATGEKGAAAVLNSATSSNPPNGGTPAAVTLREQSSTRSLPCSSSSSSTSGNASPASSILTAPDFGAAVLERMLASLTTTPSVENVPALGGSDSNATNSDDDDTIALQAIPLKNGQPNNAAVPWDTFYSTCPWSYDLDSSAVSLPAPTTMVKTQSNDDTASEHQVSSSTVVPTLARPESSSLPDTISSASSSSPPPLVEPSSQSQQHNQLAVNPREQPSNNRHSCGADSGLGGMDLVSYSQQTTENLPAVIDDEDPSTPQLMPVARHQQQQQQSIAPAQRVVPRTVITSTSSAASGSSNSSERCDLDDIVSFTAEHMGNGTCAGAPSVSESLMTHADDVTVIEHGASTKRTGFLNLKNYMVRRRDRLELATRRRWTRYWTCLKSSVLLLYSLDTTNDGEVQKPNGSANAKHFIVIEEVLCQPLPEHPKRDNCFSLSTTSGDVFLLQADSLAERDAWIASIHAACATALTSQPTVQSAMRILRTEVGRLDQAVLFQRRNLDAKQDCIPTATASQSMTSAVSEWESLILSSFVYRTYLASLQQAELPNPKTLLAQVSPQTKAVLRKIGAFTVSALHAILSARGLLRSEDILSQQQQLQQQQQQQQLPDSAEKLQAPPSRSFLHTPDSLEIAQNASQLAIMRIPVRLPNGSMVFFEWPPVSSATSLAPTTPTPKAMPGAGVTHTKAALILKHLCSTLTQPALSAPDHFLMARFKGEEEFRIVDRNEVLLLNVIDTMCVEPRSVIRIDLSRSSLQEQFGVEVESELDGDGCDQPQDELMRIFVSRVDADARGASSGVQVGDEILVINNRLVANLDMATIEQFFEQCLNVRLTLRVARRRNQAIVAPEQQQFTATTAANNNNNNNNKLNNGARSTSPQQQLLQDSSSQDELQQLVGQQQQQVYDQANNKQNVPSFAESMKNKEEIIARPVQRKTSLTDTQKLYRAFRELIETEYAYLRDLRSLLDIYLAPLRDCVFTHDDNFAALYDAAHDVSLFQGQFAALLEDAFHLLPSFRGHHQAADLLLQPADFRKPLLTLSATFRCYAAKFKLYSSFSVRHSKCLQLLQDPTLQTNGTYQQLLSAANPSQQHSMTLESYLIKPIQRILRYPLILDQLRQLSQSSFAQDDQEPSRLLGEASKIMAMVAEHVNELQKIFDEFGSLFDNVVTEYRQAFPSVPLVFSQQQSQQQRAELNIADLEMYGHVEWLENPTKASRKGREIYSICFVFTEALVIVCKERSRKATNGQSKAPRFGPKSSPEQPNGDDEIVHYQRLLPLVDVSLRIPPAPPGYDLVKHPLWQVVYRIPTSRVSSPSGDFDASSASEVIFTFANSSYENKQEFVQTISSLLRQLRYNEAPALPPKMRQQNSRRHLTNGQQQRSRSVGRLQQQNRVQQDDVYDLQPIRAPPLPPRHNNQPQQVVVARGDGSTSSGGNSDSLNSSIGSINNGQPQQPQQQQNRPLNQQQQRVNSAAKLLFMSPAGSSSLSSSGQSRVLQQQQPVLPARTNNNNNLDPQSSPVWKPRGLEHQITAQPIRANQRTTNAAMTTSGSAVPRSKSPGNERLYWHDSEVVLYHQNNSQRNSAILTGPMQNVVQRPMMRPQIVSGDNLKAAIHQHHPQSIVAVNNTTNPSRRNGGWFSDCECNMLLGGFDATTSNIV